MPEVPPTADDLLRAALDYAARGLRVVPLYRVVDGTGDNAVCSCGRKSCKKSAGKHPRPSAWQKEATTNERLIASWWGPNGDPLGNVGVALGTGSGIVAVDIDPPNGESALATLAGDDLPPTWEMRTGLGRRLIYAIPDSLPFEPKTHAMKDADGHESIRVQGTGGQCVMPPSWHPAGRRYVWVEGRSPSEQPEPASMPAWLIRLMEPAPEKAEQTRRTVDAGGAGAFPPWTDFNRRGDWWRDILEPAGAKPAGKRADGVEYVTRPEKSGGVSATLGHYKANDGTDALYVFTGNWPSLDAGKCYDKFGALARLAFGGDYAATARELSKAGYGEQRNGRFRLPAAAQPVVETAPVAGHDERDEWGEPISLEDAYSDVPAFPLAVFPSSLAQLIRSSADAVGCPPDYAAAHALAVAAGAIGGSYDLQIKRGYTQHTNLFICVVAPPGSGKSPSCHPILQPVYDEQRRRRQEGIKSPSYVSDVTVEKLAQFLADDPRGTLMVWDEMAGWLKSFNQYKTGNAGNDRAHYLSIWDARPLKVDRKGPDHNPVFVPHPRLSIVGGIQPDVLDELRVGPSDGLFDRLLFAFPKDRGLSVETFVEIEPFHADRWSDALRKLWDLKPHDTGERQRPNLILLNQDARPAWQQWTEELATAASRHDAPPYYRQIAAKISGYAARLTLVLHLIHEAYDGIPGRGIDEQAIRRGIDTAKYFLSHADRIHRTSGRDPRILKAAAIDKWMCGLPSAVFTRSDAWDHLRRNSLFGRPEDLAEPLRLLGVHRRVRWVSTDHPDRQQRRAGGGHYEVNPALIADPVGC